MKVQPQCASCLLARVHYEASLTGQSKEIVQKSVEEAVKVLASKFRSNAIATEISTAVHRVVYEILEDEDPYLEKKKQANEIALKLYPKVKKAVNTFEDPFKASAIAAIIGNSFDYGVQGHTVEEKNFFDYFIKALRSGLTIDNLDNAMNLMKDVVYITDNCGEIVFDKLLIEKIKEKGARVSLVVRGKPILSDATMADAMMVSLTSIVDEVLTTGSNAVGINLNELPDETLKKMKESSLIIAKGMANYESLSEYDFRPVLYLLKAKCEPVAHSIGVKKGDLVAKLVK